MRLKLINNRIVGYGAFGNCDYPKHNWVDTPENIMDKYNNPLYRWDGKNPILDPMSPSPEQIEKERTDLIEKEIPFTLAQEIALINKGIKDSKDLEYLEYQDIVEKIKLKYPKEL